LQTRDRFERRFEQVAVRIDAFLTTDYLEEKNILLISEWTIGNGKMQGFVIQLAVLFSQGSDGFFELWKSFRCPGTCHFSTP